MSDQVVSVEKKERAPRKPSLPAKYNKFMAFGLLFAETLVEKGNMDASQMDSALQLLRVFSPLDEQTAFYQEFLKEKVSPKLNEIRKMIKKHNRPPRAARTKKVKAKTDAPVETPVPVESSSEESSKKKSVGRKKKEDVVQQTPVTEQTAPSAEEPVKEKKSKKEKVEKEVKTDDVSKESKKEKSKTPKKEKAAK
jgi:hypothetical protein